MRPMGLRFKKVSYSSGKSDLSIGQVAQRSGYDSEGRSTRRLNAGLVFHLESFAIKVLTQDEGVSDAVEIKLFQVFLTEGLA